MFYCLTGISLDRPNLRTTWDTNITSVYYAAKRVAKGLWVAEDSFGSGGGQVTTNPLY